MSKRVIAVDIDDVLSASAVGFAKFSNERWGSSLTADDYDEDWSKFWGVPLEEGIKRAGELHDAGLFGSYDTIGQALLVLQSLKGRYDLIVVTSRRQRIKPETDAWLAWNFPGIFSAVHYAGFYDRDKQTDVRKALVQHKAALCWELGVDYLVDDQLKHCLGAAECGVGALLFGNYRWNRVAEKLPAGVTEVHNWNEVKDYFDSKS